MSGPGSPPAVVAGVVIWTLYWVLVGSHYVKTDNAYVGAETALVTPLTSGPAKQVLAMPMVALGERVWQDDASGCFVPTHQRALGYVIQEPSLFPHLDVLHNLEYGLKRVAVAQHHGFGQIQQAVEQGVDRGPSLLVVLCAVVHVAWMVTVHPAPRNEKAPAARPGLFKRRTLRLRVSPRTPRAADGRG